MFELLNWYLAKRLCKGASNATPLSAFACLTSRPAFAWSNPRERFGGSFEATAVPSEDKADLAVNIDVSRGKHVGCHADNVAWRANGVKWIAIYQNNEKDSF